MNTRWQPWLTPVPVIRDEIYDIPRAFMICWWNRIRPDLTLSDGKQKSKINPEGTLNSKSYRLGNTGYVQKIKLTAAERSCSLTVLSFGGVCHAQMKADVDTMRFSLQCPLQN